MDDRQLRRPERERDPERVDLRAELVKLEAEIDSLKIQYEQFFSGLLPFAPDKPHADLKRHFRKLLKAPFKSSEINFRLKTLEGRYHTFNTYWQRTLKQREEGTYSRDVFKANLREKNAFEDNRAQTAEGTAERGIVSLFNSYKQALEQQTGSAHSLDFDKFKNSIVQRARDLNEKNQGKKLSFKVTVKDGKVSIQARLKEKAGPSES